MDAVIWRVFGLLGHIASEVDFLDFRLILNGTCAFSCRSASWNESVSASSSMIGFAPWLQVRLDSFCFGFDWTTGSFNENSTKKKN
ncbi:unnamed protein product [Rhizophagus irregularis]|nr:unnamed protein product [Rhizophagus irregularis]CAB5366286.1 unnamed protein product [Rhizophagus irregularis]